MRTIGIEALKQNASQVLRDVEANGVYVITVAGRPVATISPLATSSDWVSTEEVLRRMGGRRRSDDWGDDVVEFRDASPQLRDP